MGSSIVYDSAVHGGRPIKPSEEETIEYILSLLAELANLAQQEISDDYVKERVCEVIAVFEGCIICRDPKSLC
jgi:hypothetical protein